MRVKEIRDLQTNELTGYFLEELRVPLAEGNRHYQQIQEWIAEGNTPEPAFTEEELNILTQQKLAREAKQIRDDALRNLTHDFGDGRVIQVRPADFANDELNIRNAIERMQRLGLTQQPWVMVDNTSHMVTVAELEEAITSGQDQAAAIWQTYIEAIS